MADIVALLDANVVYPVSLCDVLLRCALAGLYRPLWSAEILAEMVRNLVADGWSTQERAERRARHMRQAFPPMTVDQVLDSLSVHAPGFSQRVQDAIRRATAE
jgi:hypothetical protein